MVIAGCVSQPRRVLSKHESGCQGSGCRKHALPRRRTMPATFIGRISSDLDALNGVPALCCRHIALGQVGGGCAYRPCAPTKIAQTVPRIDGPSTPRMVRDFLTRRDGGRHAQAASLRCCSVGGGHHISGACFGAASWSSQSWNSCVPVVAKCWLCCGITTGTDVPLQPRSASAA